MADVDSASKNKEAVAQTEKPKGVKPEKPDEVIYKEELAKAEKDLEKAKARLADVRAKLDLVQNKNKDSPHAQKVSSLREELDDIRKKQSSKKDSRKKVQDQVVRLDEKLKSLINEQKKERGRVPYKSVDEVDREIERLQKQVDTGTMKIVDEKKALSDISNLHRQKKTFAIFSQSQKQIDEIKSQIADLKKSMDDPESKALSGRYDEIRKELDDLKKLSDDAFKNLNTLRDERTKASKEQSEYYDKIKDIKDRYFQAKREHHQWEQDQRKQRREKYAAEKAAYESGKRREIAQRKLEDASAPAYQDEIITGENLIRHFDPSAAETKVEISPGKFAAVASRTVDDSAFKGMRVVKKDDDDENYFVGASKKKKGKKAPGATATSSEPTKFNLSVDVIEQLAKIGIDPPVSQSHVPIAITKIKEKIEFWKKDQDRKTKENVEKAKKEIERLEAETSPSAPVNMDKGAKDTHKKPAAANIGTNGKVSAEAELQQEKDAVADAAVELENSKIEDAQA